MYRFFITNLLLSGVSVRKEGPLEFSNIRRLSIFDFRFLNHRFPRYFSFSDRFPSYFFKFRNRTKEDWNFRKKGVNIEEGWNFRKEGLKIKTVDGD